TKRLKLRSLSLLLRKKLKAMTEWSRNTNGWPRNWKRAGQCSRQERRRHSEMYRSIQTKAAAGSSFPGRHSAAHAGARGIVRRPRRHGDRGDQRRGRIRRRSGDGGRPGHAGALPTSLGAMSKPRFETTRPSLKGYSFAWRSATNSESCSKSGKSSFVCF